METKKYEVQVYYTSFCTYEINAETEDEAILIARQRKINHEELSSNLDNWKEADTANEI